MLLVSVQRAKNLHLAHFYQKSLYRYTNFFDELPNLSTILKKPFQMGTRECLCNKLVWPLVRDDLCGTLMLQTGGKLFHTFINILGLG